MNTRSAQTKWIWISSSLFALITSILKSIIFPDARFNPPLLFVGIVTFFFTSLLWWVFLVRSSKVGTSRGAVVGALIGLLAPPLIWLLYGMYLFFTIARSDAVGWSVVYAFIMLTQVSWLTMIPGALIGAAIAFVEKAQLQITNNTSIA